MANRYWVGGSGTWNSTNTTNWSTTSGGAGGASVPTSADSVFFDQAGTYTVNMGNQSCLDFNVTAGTVTFIGTNVFYIYGSMSVIASTVMTSFSGIYFRATSGTRTITTNNIDLTGLYTYFGDAGGTATWSLGSNFNSRGITHTAGTFNTNNYAISTYANIGWGAGTVNLGSSTVDGFIITFQNCTANLGSSLIRPTGTFACYSGTTVNAGTSTIQVPAGFSFDGGGYTYNTVECLSTGGTFSITGSNTFNTLTFTPGITVSLAAGTTQTVTNITITGSASKTLTIKSSSAGTQATLSKASGTVSGSYLSLQDSNATGGATWIAYNSTVKSNVTGWLVSSNSGFFNFFPM